MLIRSKLQPPRQAVNVLHRTHLVNVLARHDPPPLTILNAPAGYGKSTLLSQAHAEWRRQGTIIAWYSADDGKIEQSQFFAYLMAALQAAGLPLPYPEDVVQAGLPGVIGDQAARAIVVALEGSEEPVRVVIDDYHRVACRQTDQFLDYIISRMPGHAAFVLSTRGEPGLSLGPLRVHNMLRVIDPRELCFSLEETWQVLSQCGTPDLFDAETLRARTEGWPAAVQLLRLWAEEHPQRIDIGAPNCGSSDLANYLAEQLFLDLPSDLRSFLAATSIVRQVNADLADAIMDRTDSRARLNRLERLNFLVAPDDEEHEWYRYHPLLADFLHETLRMTRAADIPMLHRRASQWLARSGHLSEALFHAERTGDPDAAVTILEQAGGWRVGLGGGGLPLLRCLKDVPSGSPARYPRVWLGQVYLAGQEGRVEQARGMLDSLRAHFPPAQLAANPALECEILGNDIVLRIYEDRPQPPDYASRLEELLAQSRLTPDEIAFSTQLLCLLHYENHDDAKCRAYGEMALGMNSVHGMAHATTYLYQYLGLAQLRHGRRPEAEIFFRRAVDHATRCFGEGSHPVACARILLGRAFYLAEKLALAEEMIGPALEQMEVGEGWFEIYQAAYVSSAWIAARTGSRDQAEQMLTRAQRLHRSRGQSRLVVAIGIARLRIAIWFGDIDQAENALVQLELAEKACARQDAELSCAAITARISFDLLRGRDVAEEEVATLQQHAQAAGSLIRQVEAGILHAIALTQWGQASAAVPVLRQAIASVMSEDLGSIVSQFGEALFSRLLRICTDNFQSFSPDERSFLTRLAGRLAERQGRARPPTVQEVVVTPREVDVLKGLADGMSSKEIARVLDIAESTVKTHRINLYRKLDVATRSRAIARARALGFL